MFTSKEVAEALDPRRAEVTQLAVSIAALLRSLPTGHGLEAGRTMLAGLTKVYAEYLPGAEPETPPIARLRLARHGEVQRA